MIITSIVAAIAGMIALGYVRGHRGKISFDPQRIGVSITKPGYQSWYFSVSDGQWYDETRKKWVQQWRWPKFTHTDMRGFLWITNNVFVFTNTNSLAVIKGK